MRSFAAALVLVLAAAARAEAQSDSDLARVLTQRGWFDLAEDVCDRLLKDSRASAGERAAVPLIQAEIRVAQASVETDLDKARKLLEEGVAGLTKVLDDPAAGDLRLEARALLGWVRGRRAQRIGEALELEQDASKHGALLDLASTGYAEAEKFYRETIEALQKEKQTDAIAGAVMDAKLELPRMMLERAKLGRSQEEERKKLLNDAIKLLVDFEYDYGNRGIAFEAALLGGQCFAELGDTQKARQKLEMAMGLQKALHEARMEPNDYHHRVIWGAGIALAQLLTRTNRAAEANQFVDRYLRENRGLEKEWGGYALRLEKADALFALGNAAGAVAIVADLQKNPAAGRYAYLASERMRRYTSAGGVAVTADQMMTTADTYIEKEQFRDALIALRRCVEACSTDDEKKKFLLTAWYKTGQCLAAMKRNYEAAQVYDLVCKLDPKHDLSGKACSEIARCYFQEFAISGDKRDEDAKKRAVDHLASVHRDHPAAINIPYMQAEEFETKGDLRGAAQRYLSVSEKAEAYEAALVRGAYCYRVSATQKHAQAKDKKAQDEAAGDLKLAEVALQKFLALAAQPERAPREPALVRARANLIFLANEQLAQIYMHESIGRAQDGLTLLERGAKELDPDDDRLARNWGMQVQCLLKLGQGDRAVAIVESMFERFPDGLAIAQACKSVGIHLDTITQDMIKGQKDPTQISANLKRISKYYRKWIDEGITRGMRVTTPDVIAVADALYLMAKRLNGLDENMISFLDLKERKIAERGVFEDAANVLVLLLSGQRLSESQKIGAMTRLARCYSFTARDLQDWDKAKEQYDNIVKAFKLVDPVTNTLNVTVLQQHLELLGVYLELGYVYYEIGKLGERFQLDNAYGLFSNVNRVAQTDSEPWWLSKYMVLELLYARGKDSDLKMAHLGLKNLEENFPDFDKSRFGMKERLLDLKRRLARDYRGQ